jgi:hypothetical protein
MLRLVIQTEEKDISKNPLDENPNPSVVED